MCSRAAGISASMCSCSVGSARGVTETHLKASLAGRVWAVEKMGAPSGSRGEPVGWRHRVCSAGRCLSGPCRAGLCRGCRQHCWEEQPWVQEWLSPAVSAALWSWPPLHPCGQALAVGDVNSNQLWVFSWVVSFRGQNSCCVPRAGVGRA